MNKYMVDVVILGAGGHARVIADIIEAEGNKVIAFLDDDLSIADVKGPISDYKKYPNAEFVIGIGSVDAREELSKLPVKWHTAIHPSAIISKSVKIGEGTVVMHRVVINARTSVGRHAIINTGAIVEHDNKISDFAHISVGVNLGGTVSVGKRSWIGIGSTVKQSVVVGDDVFIGAGALVIKDISKPGTYIGVPAHLMEKK